jgi:hypothetical protein
MIQGTIDQGGLVLGGLRRLVIPFFRAEGGTNGQSLRSVLETAGTA